MDTTVETTFRYNVKMSCGGCSGAVTRVLEKLKAAGKITAFTVSLEDQSAVVKTSSMTYEAVMEVIAKTGKSVSKPETGAETTAEDPKEEDLKEEENQAQETKDGSNVPTNADTQTLSSEASEETVV